MGELGFTRGQRNLFTTIPARPVNFAQRRGLDLAVIMIRLSPAHAAYLDSCARIRDISRTRLAEQLLEVIASDQLVLSVLDDDSKPATRVKHKHRWRAPAE